MEKIKYNMASPRRLASLRYWNPSHAATSKQAKPILFAEKMGNTVLRRACLDSTLVHQYSGPKADHLE